MVVEHLLHRDYISDAELLVTLECPGHPAVTYGYYCLSPEEVSDGLILRSMQIMRCTMCDPAMEDVQAKVENLEGYYCELGYRVSDLCFKEL